MSRSLRAHAAVTLQQVIYQGRSLSQVLPKANERVEPRQQALLSEFCYGVCRWYFSLRSLSSMLLEKPLRDKDTDVEALLLLGLYQLRHMHIPSHAAISETVAACQDLKKPWASKLLNAVLRRYQRESETLEPQLQNSDVPATAHPKWLIKQLQRDWPEQWREITDANNERSPMTLRVNQQQGSRVQYLQRCHEQNFPASAGQFSTVSINLQSPCDPHELPGFAAGDVSVQDEAAQLSSTLLRLKPGQRVLDACAAPGGKSCHILEHQPAIDSLTCLEIDQARSSRIHENLSRLGLTAEVKVADAGKPDDWWNGELFDRILLDAPCSGTGVIRRHPDIKLLRRREDIPQLATLQQQLLQTLWPLLKPGGLLLYATCSVLRAENSDQISSFLEAQPDANEEIINASWGQSCNAGRQLFPQQGGHDGFYYALLRKTAG